MDIHAERDTEIRTEHPEVYEPPMLDEIGGFTALTRSDGNGTQVDGFGYYPTR
ncbi:MAG: lasso RiPP family leader peptide-containing protein [Actinomycetota bacterium]|nr:lasso RiPP family leader peptide-containing protein [Actinomycetota bacterium]